MRLVAVLALAMIIGALARAQTVEVRYELIGVTDAQAIEGRVFVKQSGQSVATKPVGYIEVAESVDPDKVTVTALRAVDFHEAKITKLAPRIWTIEEPGAWIVATIGPGLKPIHGLKIGEAPKPPDPEPDPVPDLPNEYNVGLVALQSAPADTFLAKQIAALYLFGADQLFGRPAIKDIVAIKSEIDTKFAARQCRDKATCEHWGRWKTAIDKALIAEQQRRKMFSREDWYRALREVAAGLEAVR